MSSMAFVFYNEKRDKCYIIICAVYHMKNVYKIHTVVNIVAKGNRALLLPKIKERLGYWLYKIPFNGTFDKRFEYEEAKIPT